MRLLSYNIHKGIGGRDRRYRLERIIEVIAAEKPDLVCLQEVDRKVRRSQFHDQPRVLAQELRAAAHLYQLNVPIGDGGYGNLILSRWPFEREHRLCLRLGWRKPRGAVMVVVRTDEGPLHLVNWHLGLAEKERHWQVSHLLSHPSFCRYAHLPTLIVGDFNDWRDTLGKNAFLEHQFKQATAPSKLYRSFPAFLSVMSLDKLFYRGAVEIEEARIVRTPLAQQASDHLPLVADFRVPVRGQVLPAGSLASPS